MDFNYTADQEMLRKSVAEFLKKECPFDEVKAIQDSVEGYSAKIWKKMARLEWMGICFDEQYGGFEDPYANLLIILEEMGKRAFPSPYVSTVVRCGQLIQENGNASQKKALLTGIARGKLLMALAQYEEPFDYLPWAGKTTASDVGDHFVVNGHKLFVQDANVAGKLIVSAKTDDGVSLLVMDADAPGIRIEKMGTIGSDNACALIFDEVSVPCANLLGKPGEGTAMLDRLAPKIFLAESAWILGGCKAAMDMAADYARQRVQYGVPIGGQQSIQHYLANMKIGYDTCLNYFYKVAWMHDQGMDTTCDASALKAVVSEHYNYVGYHAVRIHGGVGLTREFDVSLFFRDAKACELRSGSPAFHYERVAQQLGL